MYACPNCHKIACECYGTPKAAIHTAPGTDPARLIRYKADQIMNMPAGRQLQVGDLPHAPREETVSGPALVSALIFAQFPLDPNRMAPKGHRFTKSHVKPSSAARRAARIARGALLVTGDGQLTGKI